MRTNIVLDDKLLAETMKLSKARTKKEAVSLALQEYVENKKRMDIRDLKGMILFEEGYDYKASREGK